MSCDGLRGSSTRNVGPSRRLWLPRRLKKLKLASLGDVVVLFEGLVNLHERRSLLRDTAVGKKQTSKLKKTDDTYQGAMR